MSINHTDDLHAMLRDDFDISDFEDTEEVERVKADLDEDDRATVDELICTIEQIGEETELIDDDEFVDYAQQLAEDVGAIPRDAGWPTYHIDWEAAAASLRMDYTYIDILGTQYLYRA